SMPHNFTRSVRSSVTPLMRRPIGYLDPERDDLVILDGRVHLDAVAVHDYPPPPGPHRPGAGLSGSCRLAHPRQRGEKRPDRGCRNNGFTVDLACVETTGVD